MPRGPSGSYTYPDGTRGQPGQTIYSARYNTFLDDLAFTLNTALPVNMGGTGGTTVSQARDNLDAEVAMQIVTNYDTHVWEAGSFKSAPGATGVPAGTAGTVMSGICHLYDNGSIALEAYAHGNPATKYTRTKYSTWQPWVNVESGLRRTSTGSDVNLSIQSTDRDIMLVSPLTTSRVWTLPLANSVPAGTEIRIMDLVGGISPTNVLVITRSGSDSINWSSSVTLNVAYGSASLKSNGAAAWQVLSLRRGPKLSAYTGGSGNHICENGAVFYRARGKGGGGGGSGGGGSAGNGGNGGNTTFAGAVANGGMGGQGIFSNNGGTATGGNMVYTGQAGFSGFIVASGGASGGGGGGVGGGRAPHGFPGEAAGINSGSGGGGGGVTTSGSSGAGGAEAGLFEVYNPAPSGTPIAYAIGASGSPGVAGSGGSGGGFGGDGYLIIEEYFL